MWGDLKAMLEINKNVCAEEENEIFIKLHHSQSTPFPIKILVAVMHMHVYYVPSIFHIVPFFPTEISIDNELSTLAVFES